MEVNQKGSEQERNVLLIQHAGNKASRLASKLAREPAARLLGNVDSAIQSKRAGNKLASWKVCKKKQIITLASKLVMKRSRK